MDQNNQVSEEFIKEVLIRDISQMVDTTEEEHILLMFHQNLKTTLAHVLPIITGNACSYVKWLWESHNPVLKKPMES